MDSKYELIGASPSDADWIDELTQKTMTPYVEASWETEEERDNYFELNRFSADDTKVIIVDNSRAGRITCLREPGIWSIEEIHLKEEFHGRGLGTKILEDTISDARKAGAAVELKCLKTNPVQRLYRRLGFKVVRQDEKRIYFRLN